MMSRIQAFSKLFLGLALIAFGAHPASASVVTISGAGLAGLDYRPDGETAQYQAGTPDVAYLYTSDSGLNGGAPLVYVKAANSGLATLGTLNTFGASYQLTGSSTPTGTQPYWLTYLFDPSGGYVGVISFGGPDFDDSTQIHVFCDFAGGPCTNTYWGDTLGTLKGTAYGGTTFGQLTVYEAGIEIGNWDNGAATIPASASIQSITISTEVPEPGSMLLIGTALFALAEQRRKAQRR